MSLSELTPSSQKILQGILDGIVGLGARPGDAEWEATKTWALPRLQARDQRAAEWVADCQEAYDYAVAEGFADPLDYAQNRAHALARLRILERRQKANLEAVKLGTRKATNRLAEKRETASKNAHGNRRRYLQADRIYLEIIGAAEAEGLPATDPLVTGKLEKRLKGYKLPHWDKTTLPLKVMAMSVALAKHGARTVNLRLSPDVQERAKSANKTVVSFLQNRIRMELKKEFEADAPEFWFVIERDNDKRFHLHGAIACPDDGLFREGIEKALRRAAGKWNSKAGQHHQLLTKPLAKPFGWATYVTKDLNVTAMSVPGKLLGWSGGVRAQAQHEWNGLRKALPHG